MADCVNPDKCLPESALLSLRMSNAWLVGPDIKRTLSKVFGSGVVTNKTLDSTVVYRAMVGLGYVSHNGWAQPTNFKTWAQAMTALNTHKAYLGCLNAHKTAATEFAPEHVHLLNSKDPWLSFNKLGNWGRREQEVRHLQPRQKLYIAVHSLTSIMVVVDSVTGLVYTKGESYRSKTEDSLAEELFCDLKGIEDTNSHTKRSKGTKPSAAKPAKGNPCTSISDSMMIMIARSNVSNFAKLSKADHLLSLFTLLHTF
jgi:hypothetical protein